ncbi:MAG TPA: DUF4139 domain-containing protein [Candidatus Dormibacteraeota bacterium]|nr:DUF4139 domain-containing protein [Candidatus Dormibacteraeota bacterium]
MLAKKMRAKNSRGKEWKWAGRCLVQGLLSGLVLAASLTAAPLPPQSAASPAEVSSSSKGRVSLAITLYNSNFALVREARRVQLPAGAVRLAFEDVPNSIESSTVHLAPARGIDVMDQSYEYDLLSPGRLLDKYLGKQMTLIFRGRQNGATHETDVPAVLLSTNGPVWKIGNEIVTGIQPNGYRFPELPGGLYSSPTLVWSLRNARPGERTLEVSYLADQMNWDANYVLDLTRNGQKGSIDGWVTLKNNSGAAFENASLSLVAGQVHRAAGPGPRPMPMMLRAQAAVVGGVGGQFTQQATGEYHLYQLNRRVDLRSNESKQIHLLSAPAVPVVETYVVEGHSEIFRTRLPQGAPTPVPASVYLSFRNDAGAGLGEPLPAGTVRVYQPDSQGNPIFLGEDRIDHTPKGETARLNIGNAFDITARRRQTDFRVISPRVRESAFEVTLHNHKSEPVTVEVREPVGGSWELVGSNFPAKKPNAFTLEFDVPVPAGGSATLTYRVRVTD